WPSTARVWSHSPNLVRRPLAPGATMDSLAPSPGDGPSTTPQPAASRKPWRRLLLLGLIIVLAGSLWGAHEWQQHRPSPPPDAPPALRASPFLNTAAGVKYVGTARCAECHVEASAYAKHPMGRSVSPARQWLAGQAAAPPTFEASGLRYAVERREPGIF